MKTGTFRFVFVVCSFPRERATDIYPVLAERIVDAVSGWAVFGDAARSVFVFVLVHVLAFSILNRAEHHCSGVQATPSFKTYPTPRLFSTLEFSFVHSTGHRSGGASVLYRIVSFLRLLSKLTQ